MKKVILLSSLLLISGFARADVFAEPFIGVQSGNFGGNNATADSKGTSVGLRLGYGKAMPWFALEGLYTKGTIALTPEANFAATDLSVVFGADLKALRPFAGYVASSKSLVEAGSNSQTYSGTGFKIGIDVKLAPKITFHVESIRYTYTEADGVALSSEYKAESLVAGLGIRF